MVPLVYHSLQSVYNHGGIIEIDIYGKPFVHLSK
jgi:hypothetical protein